MNLSEQILQVQHALHYHLLQKMKIWKVFQVKKVIEIVIEFVVLKGVLRHLDLEVSFQINNCYVILNGIIQSFSHELIRLMIFPEVRALLNEFSLNTFHFILFE